jgi:small-conductance mechanosensitive channel
MNPLLADLGALVAYIATSPGLTEVAVLIAGLGIAWAVSRQLKSKMPADLDPGGMKVMAGGFNRVVFPLLALGVIWVTHIAIMRHMPVPLLKLAIPILSSFAIIRLLVYLVRHLLAPSAMLKASERIIAYAIWAFAVLYLTGLLREVETALSEVAFTIGKQKITLLMVVTGVVTVAFTLLVSMAVARIAERRIMAQENVSLSLRLAITKGLQALAILLAILIGLPLVGIDLTVLSVFGGAIGVGLGLGLQKVAANYVSGFIILLEHSVRVGDLVTVDNRQGIITAINGRFTVIRGLDGTESLVPNDTLITQPVVNHTYSDPKTAVKIPLTVAYDTNLDELESLLIGLAETQDRVLKDPPPAMLVRNLGDNGIEVELVLWIEDAEQGQGKLRSDLLRLIWKRFGEIGIEVPFPQRELRFHPQSTAQQQSAKKLEPAAGS